jgi:hypothetical protein
MGVAPNVVPLWRDVFFVVAWSGLISGGGCCSEVDRCVTGSSSSGMPGVERTQAGQHEHNDGQCEPEWRALRREYWRGSRRCRRCLGRSSGWRECVCRCHRHCWRWRWARRLGWAAAFLTRAGDAGQVGVRALVAGAARLRQAAAELARPALTAGRRLGANVSRTTWLIKVTALRACARSETEQEYDGNGEAIGHDAQATFYQRKRRHLGRLTLEMRIVRINGLVDVTPRSRTLPATPQRSLKTPDEPLYGAAKGPC